MEYQHLIRDDYYKGPWLLSGANELGQLAQGVGNQITGTNIIFVNRKYQVQIGRIVTYPRIVSTVRPEKYKPNRTRITAGENLITDYPETVSTETSELETIKIHWNSVLSTKDAR